MKLSTLAGCSLNLYAVISSQSKLSNPKELLILELEKCLEKVNNEKNGALKPIFGPDEMSVL